MEAECKVSDGFWADVKSFGDRLHDPACKGDPTSLALLHVLVCSKCTYYGATSSAEKLCGIAGVAYAVMHFHTLHPDESEMWNANDWILMRSIKSEKIEHFLNEALNVFKEGRVLCVIGEVCPSAT
jgi:hypothetical protein